MAGQAKGTQVLQVTFAPAFGDRKDVVGIPESFAREPAEAPVREKFLAMRSARALQIAVCRAGVQAADRAYASVAGKDPRFTNPPGIVR